MTTPKKSDFLSRRMALAGIRSLAGKGFGSAAGAAITKALKPFPFVGDKKGKARGGKVKK